MNIVDLVAILINAAQKGKNLFKRQKVIKICFAINVDMIRNIVRNTINSEKNIMLSHKIIIDINEKTVLNFQQSIEKFKAFVFLADKLIRKKQLVKLLAIADKIIDNDKISDINSKQIRIVNRNVLIA